MPSGTKKESLPLKRLLGSIALGLGLLISGLAPVGAQPMIWGCAQEANGVIGFHAQDPGWSNIETGEHHPEHWMRLRVHGNGIDQVIYEDYVPREEFETDGYIWGLESGKTYKIEYWEEIPGYGGFKADLWSCTAAGDSALPFGFDVTVDNTNASYPDEPAPTPDPTPAPTPKPTTPPSSGSDEDNTTETPSTPPTGELPSESPALGDGEISPVVSSDVAVADDLAAVPALTSEDPIIDELPATDGPYAIVLALLGGLIALLLVAARRRKRTNP